MEVFEQAKNIIEEASTICLAAHVRPDGDAIGSLGAMYNFLKEMGKEVYMVIPSRSPKYDFMPSISEAVQQVPLDQYDLLICLDVSAENRLSISEEDKSKAQKVLVIDHHKGNNVTADVRLVVDNAPANCEIIYNVITYMKGHISKKVASYIYLGLMTDTGSFNYERTTGQTYRIAGEMIDLGADFVNICKQINDTYSMAKMRLIAYTIDNMESYFEGRVRICAIHKEMLDSIGATEEDKEGMVNYLRCIEGTKVAVYISPLTDEEYKVSIRTEEPVDAQELVLSFGGGGHARAAGFETRDVEQTKKKLIDMLERLL